MLTSCFFEIMLKADKKLLKQNAESLSELTRTQKESWDAQVKVLHQKN